MKKLLCILLCAATFVTASLALSGCGCSNSTGKFEPGYIVEPTEPDMKDGDFGFYIIKNNQLMVSEYTGSDKDIVIPSTYQNYTITVIGPSVFNGSDITSVSMPDTITEVQDYAFSSCSELTKVKFSNNTKTFGNCVFFNCPKLTNVEIPASVKNLGSRTFSATGIESVTIPKSDTLTTIGDFVFFQCQKLKEVNIPETITEINDNAFSDCPNKIKIKAPNGSYAQNYAEKNDFDFEISK